MHCGGAELGLEAGGFEYALFAIEAAVGEVINYAPSGAHDNHPRDKDDQDQ